MRVLVTVLFLVLGTGVGDAQEPSPTSSHTLPSRKSTVLAIVPGVLVHGAGHLAAGDLQTGLQLMKWEAIGIGLIGVGGFTAWLTGGSRYTNEFVMPTMVMGSGLFLQSFVADLVGSIRGETRHQSASLPSRSVELGYAYVEDSVFPYHQFATVQARFSWQNFSVSPQFWYAFDSPHQDIKVPLRYQRSFGREGEMWFTETPTQYQNFSDSGFHSIAGALRIGAQLSLARIGKTLSGSYVNASIGYGLQSIHYDAPQANPDNKGLPLLRFGYVLALPRASSVELFYNHRRDRLAGGISPGKGLGSGYLGYFGASSRISLSTHYSLNLQSQIGSAFVGQIGLEYSFGDYQ